MKATLRRISKTELEFSNNGDTQRFPFTYADTLKIRDYCKENGIRVEVEDRLKEWIKNETAQRHWPFELLPIESTIGKALVQRSFQRKGIVFAKEHKVVLNADEPGLGKTLQAMGAVVENGCTGSILVVAPKTAVYVTWPHELQAWINEIAPHDEWVIIGGKMTKLERIRALKRVLQWDMGKNRIGPRQWVIVSPNYLRLKPKVDWRGNFVYNEDKEKIIVSVREAMPALLAIDWAAIIVDEAHQTLAGATGDVKKQSAQRQGLGLLEVQKDGMRIALTGTPFRGKHEYLWGILNWLYPNKFSSYWSWVDRHFHVYIDPMTNARVVGALRNEERLAEELRHIMIRRTKQEVAKELPRKRYGGTPLLLGTGHEGPVAVWLDMFGQQRKAYEAMVAAAMVELEGGTLMANGILAEMTRLKQFSNSYGFIGGQDEFFPTFPSNKFDWLLDFLSDRGIDGKGPGVSKVIVASQFTKHVDLFSHQLREKYKIPVFTLTGKTSENERVRLQRDFQRGTLDSGEPAPDVFFLNTKAGGVSLTLDAADDVVIIDSTFNPDDQEQVEDRAHRLSRMHNVTVWYLASLGSIDESIARHCFKMETSIKKILDGDRGVDFAKILLSDAL
jgi:SNF2 family DNA or RNA helicase